MDSGARSNDRDSGDGQIMVLFALFALVLVGVLALAVDVGYLLTERREVQSAADAAALAGAAAMLGGDDNAAIVAVSKDYAQTNGINAGTVTVNVDPIDPDAEIQEGTVTVDIETPVQRFFLGAIYSGPWEVGAHAVAEVTEVADARYALVALDPTIGIEISGGGDVIVINGGIISAGNIAADGNSNVVTSDGFIDAVGIVEENAQWSSPPEYGIREKRGDPDDPFDSVTPPAVPGAPAPPENATTTPTTISCPNTATCVMNPGYYLNVKIDIKGQMKLNPGLYYFENSTIELFNSSSRIYDVPEDGDGVTLYFTGSTAKFLPKTGIVELEAPNHPNPGGDWGDMVIWIENCLNLNAQGTGKFTVGGVIYAPCSSVWLHGDPTSNAVSGMVIAGTLYIDGSIDFKVSYIPYGPMSSDEVYLRE